MKRFIIAILLVAVLLAATACSKKARTLYVFNWSDYIDPELVTQFEKEHNCKVKIPTYDSNENMFAKIESTRESFDIAVPSGDHVTLLAQKGYLEPLDKTKLTHWGNLDPKLLEKAKSFDPGNQYAVPYFWGLTGLLYNKKKVPDEVLKSGSWAILGDKHFSGKQKISMLEDAREVVGAALVYKGYNINDSSPEALKAASEALAIWDQNVSQYDSESYKNEVADGTTWLGQAYNGDALQQMELNKDLGFLLPVEGTSLWMDSMVILKSSQNKDLAYDFINYMLESETAKTNADYVKYATPNAEATKLLDPAFTGNPLIYPSAEYLDKCYMIEFLGDKVKAINDLFEQIRMN
jgi:spermidine/putrescine transport system substrate-binding protein